MARIAAAVCVLGVVALACAAQDSVATYAVKGAVLDSVTHQPVARVLVEAGADAVLTDNDGHFELDLPAGEAQINLRRPGYTALRGGAMRRVRVGANMPDLTFTLTPQAIITGHVTLSTGDEADGIRIMAYRKRIVNGREGWVMQGMAPTNSEGAFRLANLEAPASYLLYSMPAHDRVGAIAPGAVGYGYPSVYYPGVADVSAAGILTLSPGQQAQADFALTRQPFYPVTITMPEGRQGRGGGIQIHDMSGRTLEFSTRSNPQQNTAEVNLPSGHYFAEERSGGEMQSYGRVDFTVAGGPVSGLSMTVLPLHGVPVEIHKDFTASNNGQAQGIAYSGTSIEFNAGLNVTLASADAFEPQMGTGGLRHVEGSSDGSLFQIENVVPGRYWVEAFPFQGYVSSATSGGVDLTREPLVVGPGSTVAPIEITLRDDMGKISGQVNLSSGLSSGTGQSSATGQAGSTGAGTELGEASAAYVYAIPLFPTASRVSQAMAQGDGQFSFGNLAPGSYRLIALDQPREIDANDPQDLAQYAGKGETVTVEANGTANAQLDVIRTTDEGTTP